MKSLVRHLTLETMIQIKHDLLKAQGECNTSSEAVMLGKKIEEIELYIRLSEAQIKF